MLNYKSEDVIFKAIDSIREDYIGIRILILDNGSTKKSYEHLCQIKDERIEIIISEENTGFASGCNYAFKYLKEKYNDVKYIFLLNPDAIIERNTIYNLFNTIKDKSNVAAISPHVVNDDNKTVFNGLMVNWKQCNIEHMSRKELIANKYYIDIFHGCAVLIDADKFIEAGMFYEKLFMYYDEPFLSMEFSKLSYKILYTNENTVHHSESHSLGKFSYSKSYYHSRNHIFFFQKYAINSNIFCKYRKVLKNLLSIIKQLNLHASLGIIKGIFHSLIHKTGKL